MINYDYEIDFTTSLTTSTVTIDNSCKATSLENVIERAKNYVTQLEGKVEFLKIQIWESAKPNQDPIYFTL